MLDDLRYIQERDAADTLGIAGKEGEQLLHNFEFSGDKNFSGIHNVVYAAMGGSALAASLIHTWPMLPIPFEVVRDYTLPQYVDKNTLVVVSSYSGNTEETLSALEDAETRGAQIAVIAGGGKLKQYAEEKKYLLALLPKVDQPRYAVLYNYRALLDILAIANVIKEEDFKEELEHVASDLTRKAITWGPDVMIADNPAKQIAQELMGKSVVIYGGPKMAPAAYKWKISINENAKQIAWTNQLPEFNHNEFIGWSKQPVEKPYVIVDLRSDLEHPRVQKRFEITERLLSGMRPSPIVVNVEGDTILEQLLWAINFGDFVSLYLALLNGLNPSPVDLVENFKKAMDE